MAGGPAGFPPGFTCPVVLWCHLILSAFRVRDSYPLRCVFPGSFRYTDFVSFGDPQPQMQASGLDLSPFARRYLGNRGFFLFLRVLRCFSSPGFLLTSYVFRCGYTCITMCGLPHSEICALTDICSYTQLFAACHVLRRLLVPRHSPCALSHLTFGLSFGSPALSRFVSRSVTYPRTRPRSLLALRAFSPKSGAAPRVSASWLPPFPNLL